ncbi:reverse transcriptase domain-containing protein [Candidatus Uabimicrobium sp. HlEnr_7]|uniref:reverse transcriptase domain-containing protein n=1 Tax=Candidatus Uabimicrobium helgolandensis TaxID=3095367 RepID=UPI0035590A6B
MKRKKIAVEDVACFDNLVKAATKAASGKRTSANVMQFFANFEVHLQEIRERILAGKVASGELHQFTIFDPKRRIIRAPNFPDRVLHHAIMNFVAPVLDRAMISSSFACRPQKGNHAAIRQVQKNIRRFLYYAKIDIHSYFDAIDHRLLYQKLERRFKGTQVLNLLKNIIHNYQSSPGKGLPIGTLPSQHFANYFLDSLDRYILEELKVCAVVRYMDDIIWWCDSRSQAKRTLNQVRKYVVRQLFLQVKEAVTRMIFLGKNICYRRRDKILTMRSRKIFLLDGRVVGEKTNMAYGCHLRLKECSKVFAG